MLLNKKRLKNSKLYLILDRQVNTYDQLFQILKQAVNAGVDIIQLRDKYGSAQEQLAFAKKAMKYIQGRSLFIMNDRVDLAKLAEVDGVHLGQDDISYGDARQLLGKKFIIGVSCQNLKMAKQAQAQGVDYIGFGSVFKTQTKPDRLPMDIKVLKTVLLSVDLPVFPIGGINIDNAKHVIDSGASRLAVCRDISLAKDVTSIIQRYLQILENK